jgi:tetratricopeptide (TPR) repeat protein
VRITGQLVDAANGAHLWADKFDGALEDVFDLQDRVTEQVITAIAPTIHQAEIKRARSSRDVNLSAYDWYLRAVSAFNRSTDPYEAIGLCHRAIELSPTFAGAHALAGMSIAWLSYQGAFTDFASQSSEALDHVNTALELDPSDPDVMARAGMAIGNFGDKTLGMYWLDKAIAENPNLAWAWRNSAMQRVAFGRVEEAPERFERSLRLDPSDPRIWIAYSGLSCAHYLLSQYEEAFHSAERAVMLAPNNPNALRALAFSAAAKGDLDSARRAVATILRNDPTASIAQGIDPLRRVRWKDDRLDRFAEGLRLAGLPE